VISNAAGDKLQAKNLDYFVVRARSYFMTSKTGVAAPCIISRRAAGNIEGISAKNYWTPLKPSKSAKFSGLSSTQPAIARPKALSFWREAIGTERTARERLRKMAASATL